MSQADVRFYDWGKTLTRDADVTLVVGGRGIGKTFGLRKQFVRDFLKDGSTFVEISRYASELTDIQNGYFNKFEELNTFPGYMFKTEKDRAYIAKCSDCESDKPEWELIGYFLALTQQQAIKKRTFANVKRILMDEAVLDRNDRYHSYLPNEFFTFANVLSTVLRETTDKRTKGRVYLLGNACDLCSPYMQYLGINKPPEKFGYQWFRSKTVLFHYVEPTENDAEKRTKTLVGRLLDGTEEFETMFGNKFRNSNDDYIEEKPRKAYFDFGIVYLGNRFGIWADDGIFYINSKIPNNTERPIYSFTRADNTADYQAVERSSNRIKIILRMYYSGSVRYDSQGTREMFLDACTMFGIR